MLAPGLTGASYYWQDGSGNSTYTVVQPGTYWVNAYSADYTCMHTDTIDVKYVSAQQVFLGNDTAVCAGSFIVLKPDITTAQYNWSDGSTGSQLTARATGDYWVRVNNGSCTVADTIHVDF